MTALLTWAGTGGRYPNTSALGLSVGLLQDVLDPREAAIPSTALAQRQHEPWFPATLVPLKVLKSGGFRGPGYSLFVSVCRVFNISLSLTAAALKSG